MSALDGRHLFLSASFPSGERGERFRPYDVEAIAGAVTAVTQAILLAGGRLVFGAHPTISPLVLLVAAEVDARDSVDIYQSEHFKGQVPQETLDLVNRGFGNLHWTKATPDDRAASLHVMRTQMLTANELAAAIFIGGMEGILDELHMVRELQPQAARLPITAPGGAARLVEPSQDPVAERLAARLPSPLYPALAHDLVTALAGG